MDPAKIETIIKWETFKTVKRVQKFLGFVNFYRKFIKKIPAGNALNEFNKKNTIFDWSEITNETFSKLKQIFVTVPLLIQFDNTRETVLETNVQLGALGVLCLNISMEFFAPTLIILKRTRRPNAITKFTIKKC